MSGREAAVGSVFEWLGKDITPVAVARFTRVYADQVTWALIKAATVRDKDNSPVPEIFVLVVVFNPISHAVGLNDFNLGR